MESRILSLEAEARQNRPRAQKIEAYQQPFWDIVRLGDSVSPTATTFPEFDDTTRTDRVFSSLVTARGELIEIGQWDDHTPCRARIAFDANAAFEVKSQWFADGAGNWWLSINGTVTAYTNSQYLTLSFRAGRNVVTVFKDDANSDRIRGEMVLFDGVNAFWVPPERSK
jgi:hypothetical protein